MKVKRAYNNDDLVKALDGSKDIYRTFTYGVELDDDELIKAKKFKALNQMEKDILYLYSTSGATKTAELYGISRQYVYELLNKIKIKLQ